MAGHFKKRTSEEQCSTSYPSVETQPQLRGLGVGGSVWGRPPGPERPSHEGWQAGGGHARGRTLAGAEPRAGRDAGRWARRWVALLGRPAPDLLRPGRKSGSFRVKGRADLSARPCHPGRCIFSRGAQGPTLT